MGVLWLVCNELKSFFILRINHPGKGIRIFFRSHSRSLIEKAFNLVHYTGNGADLKLGYQLLLHVPLRGYKERKMLVLERGCMNTQTLK